jgi:hypothetical protein
MDYVTIEIVGFDDQHEIEALLEKPESGFELEDRGFGRSHRYSVLGDAVSVAGAITSAVSLAKTILEILKLRRDLAGDHKPNHDELSVNVKTSDGREIHVDLHGQYSENDVEQLIRGIS